MKNLKYTLIAFGLALMGLGFVWVQSPRPTHARTANTSMAVTTALAISGELNPNPPPNPVKLIFIHHSTGENWLNNSNGALLQALNNNHYYVSDGGGSGGPYDIGSRTDLGDWWEWFAGPDAYTITQWLYNLDQTRANAIPNPDPDAENEIVMFKSCFPNSNIWGNPDDPPNPDPDPPRGFTPGSLDHNVANIKRIYIDILEYFETRQDKLFIVIVAPPLMESSTDATRAANARAVSRWLMDEWLADYPHHNVAVFDFYNVLTTNGGDPDTNDLGWPTGNHHRLITTTTPITIQHKTNGDDDGEPNYLEYPSEGGTNDHPSQAGNRKATGEYVALLNVYYNCWKFGDCGEEAVIDWLSLTALSDTVAIHAGQEATFTLSISASAGVTGPVALALSQPPVGVLAAFDVNPLDPPGSSQLTLENTDQLTPTTYAMTVTAVYTPLGLSDSVPISLIVTLPPTFTFSLAPISRTVLAGNAVTFTGYLTALYGFDQSIALSVSDPPTGMQTLWEVTPVHPQPTAHSQLIVWTEATLPPAVYLFQTRAAADQMQVARPLTLTVITTTDTSDFALTITPFSRTVRPPQTVTYTVAISSIDGFTRPVSLSVLGLPTDSTADWSANPVSPGQHATLSVATALLSPPGPYALFVTGQAGIRAHIEPAGLVVDYPYRLYLPILQKQG
jgi:hypothetical protein